MEPGIRKKNVDQAVRAQSHSGRRIALAIHALAEPAFKEFESSSLLAEYLTDQGFEVEFPWRHMPTAFRATWGDGKPAIGMLGEYDALPDCGEKEGDWGHGCGHNLLGTGAAVGAVSAARVLEAAGLGGRIVYYGCPAEETLAGKVYMARDGAFRDMDACLAWHPGTDTGVSNTGGSSLDSLVYEFFGRTAHGASAHNGRSALDGAMLMDVAANYLREHVPENVRIHAVIRHGGDAPNVVPAYARSWYYVRGKDRAEVDSVRERLNACARGAAMATETQVKWHRLTGVYPRLPNDTLCTAVQANVELFGTPRATADDRRRAGEVLGKDADFNRAIAPGSRDQGRGSSDEDNVSWLAPMGRFQVASHARGTSGHHRDLAAQAALPFAQRAMLQAAKIFAATAVELCADTKLLRQVRMEFERRTRAFEYDPLVPKRQPVPVDPP